MELRKVRLGEICNVNARSIQKDSFEGDIQYLDTSNLAEGTISQLQEIAIAKAPSRAQRLVSDETILFSMVRPNQKHFGILSNPPENMVVSTGFATLDIKDKTHYYPAYVYYLLTQESVVNYLQTLAEGSVSAYPSINPSDIANISFTIPEYAVQRRIGKLLSDIDRKIALNRRMNATLEAMARQLYDYWFVQFDFPDAHGKPYKSSGGKMTWNNKLKREIPEGWEASNICSISDVLSGGTPSKAVVEYWNNGSIPFFGPTDYDGSMFQLGTSDYITKEGLDHCASILFKEGDIFITARGSIGKLVIVGNPMAMNQSCYALRSRYGRVEYLYFLAIQLIECLKAKGSGSVFKSITLSDIENSSLCIASPNTIETFCEKASPIFQRIKENIRNISTLTRLRTTLLPLLMNGQVGVRRAEPVMRNYE